VVERFVHIEDVRSSNLLSPTILSLYFEGGAQNYEVHASSLNLSPASEAAKIQNIDGVLHVLRQDTD
jgi:hypothetical protein